MSSAMLLRNADYEGDMIRETTAKQNSSTVRDVYELICIVEGMAEYWVEDQYYRLTRGDILLVPAGVMVSTNLKARGCPLLRHHVWFSRRFMTFMKLQDEKADYAFSRVEASGRYLLRLPPESFEMLQGGFETLQIETSAEKLNYEMSSKALLLALMVQINRMVERHGETILLAGSDNRLSPVLMYIHGNCTQSISVDGLAEQFGYSPSHLAHSFKKQLGTSLYHYVLLRRLQIGRQSMLDGIPVKEAYQRCGFGDYAGFYRAFTKEYKISPQQYKKRNA